MELRHGKTPTQVRAHDRVERVLAATATVLAELGYAKTTTNRIAEQAGVHVPSVYQYFADKDALVAELWDRHVGELIGILATMIGEHPNTPIVKTVRLYVQAVLELHMARPKLLAVLYGESARLPGVRNVRQEATELLIPYLEHHKSALRVTDLSCAAFILASAVEGRGSASSHSSGAEFCPSNRRALYAHHCLSGSSIMSTEQLLRTPKTAWPTILVALGAVAMMAFALFGAAQNMLPWWLASTLSGLAAFAAFTPMHDATHRSVSRNRTVNDWIGRLSAIVLMSPFAAFRYVHLEHHKHTNDPELDPDHYSGRGAAWTLPLRWLTQDLHYYVLIARQWSSRPRPERIEVVASLAVILGLVGILVGLGYGTAVVLVWIVPSRLAIAALSFSFDYLPHVPHQVPSSVDRFAATRILVAPGMTALFLFQNYHLIHHLYPAVPFYRYRRVYMAQRESLLAKGAQVWQWPAPKLKAQPVEN